MLAHAKRFFNFDGLDAFKAKLQPESWTPVFAIYNKPCVSFRTLYATVGAFSENAPVKLILGGLQKALLTEIKRFEKSIGGKLLGRKNTRRKKSPFLD